MTPLSIGKPGHFYYEIFTNNLGGIISDTTLNDILRISKCCGFKPLNFSIQLSAVAGEWNHLQLHILQWIQSWMCDPSVTEFMVLYMSDRLSESLPTLLWVMLFQRSKVPETSQIVYQEG